MTSIKSKIRDFVSEDKISDAVDLLVDYYEHSDSQEHDMAISLKSRYSKFKNEEMMGLGVKSETREQIVTSILQFTNKIKETDPAPPNRENHSNTYNTSTNTSPNTGTKYDFKIQCFFNNDMLQYYVDKNDDIIGYNPLNQQYFVIGKKLVDNNPMYAWKYFVHNTGMYYLVDQAGIIWGLNYGTQVQIGYVKNL